MKVLLLYLKQRFKPVIFAGLTILLILFSVSKPLEDTQIFVFILPVFILLGLLRLYDDIMNYQTDAGKPNRIYTHYHSRKLLSIQLAAFTFIFLGVLAFITPILAALLMLFLLLNDILYRLFFNIGNWRHYLPLLKYPVIVVLLYLLTATPFSQWTAGCLMVSIFCAFLVFEILNDPTFPIRSKPLILLGNISLTALIIGFNNPGSWWLYLIILIMGNLLIRWKHKVTPYLFFAFLLLAKIALETAQGILVLNL